MKLSITSASIDIDFETAQKTYFPLFSPASFTLFKCSLQIFWSITFKVTCLRLVSKLPKKFNEENILFSMRKLMRKKWEKKIQNILFKLTIFISTPTSTNACRIRMVVFERKTYRFYFISEEYGLIQFQQSNVFNWWFSNILGTDYVYNLTTFNISWIYQRGPNRDIYAVT